MHKITVFFVCLLFPIVSFGADDNVIKDAQELFNATKIVCSGLSDEISKVSNVSKANTVVTSVGTVAAGGALAVGIAKSNEEKEIDNLIAKICTKGGCTADGVGRMSDAEFFEQVMLPMAEIAELQEKIEKSKNFGNWRTGLMAGTIGTNLASAIISGLNINQSDLVQHVGACNEMLEPVNDMLVRLKTAGINPIENKIVKDLENVKTWCNKINVSDIEKIENRMKGVMGTSIAGGVIGVVGTATSATANSDKYMDNKFSLTEEEKQKEKRLNTTANIMAGANVATGLVETGLNISLITLTKKLMTQAEQCEDILK